MNQHRRHRNKSKSLYIWHRYAGLFAALFVIFITISGIALNHTDDLALKNKHVNSNFLLGLYNVQSPTVITQFVVGQQVIIQADDMLFIGDNNSLAINSSLVGGVIYEEFIVIALTDKLLLVDSAGQLLETLSKTDGIPNNISKIGLNAEQHVNVLAKNKLYRLDANLVLQAVPFDNNVTWSQNKPVSTAIKLAISERYRANIISLETLVLDIHSGRFFGSYGTLFFDFVGVILLFLACTGVIIWARQRPKKS
ncbi:MAG: PepSY domain-containing protein [Cycloclasticus sp.]